jgi:hypothetical protein
VNNPTIEVEGEMNVFVRPVTLEDENLSCHSKVEHEMCIGIKIGVVANKGIISLRFPGISGSWVTGGASAFSPWFKGGFEERGL